MNVGRALATTKVTVLGGVLILAAGCANATAEAPAKASTKTSLETAYQKCTQVKDDPDSYWDETELKTQRGFARKYTLADRGHTLIIETNSEYDFKGYKAYTCITGALGTSERVTSSIENTTSLMGRQSSTDGKLTYEYTYHPDNGLYVLITNAV